VNDRSFSITLEQTRLFINLVSITINSLNTLPILRYSKQNNMGLDDIDFSASTALVTGGSSGIGRAIAEELVARGVRQLIIVAKDETKLSQAAKEIEASKAGVKVHTIRADLTSHEAPKNIQKEIQQSGWTVDILVNNAGFGRKYNFAEDPKNDTSLACVDLMVRAVVEMSLLFLPGMKERRKGGILNIGSTACYQPVPYTAIYAASKAFVLSFSQAIREENIQGDTGIRIACVVPGVTETNLDGQGHGERRGPIEKIGVDQPEDVAKVAVDALRDNAAERVVGWNNYAFHTAMGLLPDSVNAKVIAMSRGPPGEE
jgi:short-subunit dehydrogenase